MNSLAVTDEQSLIWDVTPDLLCTVNEQGYFTHANPAWEKTLGWTPKQLETMHFQEILHPDDLFRTMEEFDKVKSGVPALRFENRYRSKSGEYRWLSWVSVPDKGRFASIVRDVTVDKNREESLRKLISHHDRFWRLSQDLFMVVRLDGFIEAANHSSAETLGLDLPTLTSCNMFELVEPEDQAALTKALQELAVTPWDEPRVFRFRRPDGQSRSIAWTGSPEGDCLYASGRDITTESKQATELQLEQDTARMRERFIAVLGHDLRNPLAAVIGASKLMKKEIQTERSHLLLDNLEISARRMSSLIDDVLSFARGRLGDGIDLSREWNEDLGGVLQQVIEEFQHGDTETTIVTEIDLPDPVHCDLKRVGQMVSNLLGNALTHGDRKQPITLRAQADDRELHISVKNHGAAIPRHLRESIFEPFERGRGSNRSPGLGLGLYICSEIARAHGGCLSMASDEDGTIFTFCAPHPQKQPATQFDLSAEQLRSTPAANAVFAA